MKLESKVFELFKNLAQLEFNGEYYDLHNDFECINIKFNQYEKYLVLLFCYEANNVSILLSFYDVHIMKFNLPFEIPIKSLTLDNLYRGRFEKDGELLELSKNEEAYFYLEFYEEHSIEFYCKSIELTRVPL